MKLDVAERQRVEEERRRAEIEAQRIQQTLDSERALALDKEEIFKRLQYRENELTEKLAEAITEQETLEDQLDEALDSKKKTDEELATRREQVLQAGQIITRLEADKKDLQRQIDKLEDELEHVEKTHTQNDDRLQTISQELRSLKSNLSVKDRKISELEASLQQAERDKESRASGLEHELRSLKGQLSQRDRATEGHEQELRSLKSQLSQRDRATEDLEKRLHRAETLRAEENRRQAEDFELQIRSLKNELNSKDRKLQDLESALSQIDQDAEAKLASTTTELQQTKKLLRELQGQTDELRKQVTSISLTSSKHEETVRRKEGELSALMADVEQHARDKMELRKENQKLAGGFDGLAEEKREVLEEMKKLREQRSKMEREAVEVKRSLERVMPFFTQHFS
jgi:myosin protein heavy chain